MEIRKRILVCIVFVCLPALFVLGAHPVPECGADQPEKALIPVDGRFPVFDDDLEFAHLALALRRNISYLKRLDPAQPFAYGSHAYPSSHVLKTHEEFLSLIERTPTANELTEKIHRRFFLYRASGRDGNEKVLFTGYYTPVFDASLSREGPFRYPIYRKPDDLVGIDLTPFGEKHNGERIVARIDGKRVVPYYTRYQIEVEKRLAGKNLEIAWLKDPFDAYLLQIEGDGRLRLRDGSLLHVGYAASNGRAYGSLGRYLLDSGHVSQEQLSIQGLRAWLSGNPKVYKEAQRQNPSYIFFKVSEDGPLGNINVPLTTGRSIALDSALFPKGALAFMSSRKPTLDPRGKATGSTSFSRFVLNQDTGSAIKGAGRADLFWGIGTDAEAAAWHQKHDGDLYVLIRKP